MEGNFKIAIVNLLEDYYKNDYGFALFDEAEVGDTVIVDSRSKQCLGTIKQILTQEEYRKNVIKEVIAVVDLSAYNNRIAERERIAKVEQEIEALKKEFNKRVKKLQDAAYYEKMAMSLQLQDPELATLANKLKELSQ